MENNKNTLYIVIALLVGLILGYMIGTSGIVNSKQAGQAISSDYDLNKRGEAGVSNTESKFVSSNDALLMCSPESKIIKDGKAEGQDLISSIQQYMIGVSSSNGVPPTGSNDLEYSCSSLQTNNGGGNFSYSCLCSGSSPSTYGSFYAYAGVCE